MSLPDFSTQAELFSTAGLAASLFPPTDRYRLFAQRVYPHLAASRVALEKCYCADNGRVALEPVLMLGVSILQDLDGMPDRQAVEMLRYHAGWNFALTHFTSKQTEITLTESTGSSCRKFQINGYSLMPSKSRICCCCSVG
jgi:hypothetical protein